MISINYAQTGDFVHTNEGEDVARIQFGPVHMFLPPGGVLARKGRELTITVTLPTGRTVTHLYNEDTPGPIRTFISEV